jgi:hypothetical protein
MEPARILRGHGFVVKCVRLSEEGRMFEGQEGAANFYTDVGVFEVLFMRSDTIEGFTPSQS